MPLSWGRGRQKGWFAAVADVVSQAWTLRWMSLPSSLWDIRLPKWRSGTYSTKYTCLGGGPAHCPLDPNEWKRPPEIFYPPYGATHERGGESKN